MSVTLDDENVLTQPLSGSAREIRQSLAAIFTLILVKEGQRAGSVWVTIERYGDGSNLRDARYAT